MEVIKNYLRDGDKNLEEVWKKNHLVICAVSNYKTILVLMEKAVQFKKPFIAIDSPELEITALSMIDTKSSEAMRDKYAKMINAKLAENKVDPNSEMVKYPYHPAQCIDWAKAVFEELVEKNYPRIQRFMENPTHFMNSFESSEDLSNYYSMLTIKLLKILYAPKYPGNFDECIELSIRTFDVHFIHTVPFQHEHPESHQEQAQGVHIVRRQ